jgi:hypothetical protein
MPHFPEVCEVTAIEFYGDPTPEARAALNGLGARSYATLLAL